MKNDIIEQQRIEKAPTTEVINIKFCYSCLSEEDLQFKDSLEEVHTYAELKRDPRASLPSTFSICFTAKRTYGTSQVFFVLLGKDRSTWLPLGLFIDENQVSRFHHWDPVGAEQPPVFPHQWVRSCLAINTESGLLRWVVDGTLVENSTVPQIKDKTNKPTDLTENIVVGVYQPPLSFQWMMIPNQVLTNMNIFSRALSIDEMIQNTKEQSCHIEGDFLAWNDMEWILHGQAVIETTDKEETCMEQPYINFYQGKFIPMESCMHFCQKLGSRVPPMATVKHWAKLETFLSMNFDRKQTNDLPHTWLPLNDNDIDGEWKDFYNQEKLNFTLPWAENEPNRGGIENCLQLSFSRGIPRIADQPCAVRGGACMCERDPLPYLRLRGLCSAWAAQDIVFQPMNNLTDCRELSLIGMKASIVYDRKQTIWIMTDVVTNMTGISTASATSLILGRHSWTIKGDRGCSKDGSEYTTELKMSGCQDGNFTCDNGQCVGMDKRCNQLPDCRDKSDENNCKTLVLEGTYNKNVPPVVSDKEGVRLSISIDILKLVAIKEEDYSIEIQFSISLKWKENRVSYHNLKKESTLNALTKEDIGKIWLPRVIYENTDQKETTRLGLIGNGRPVLLLRDSENSEEARWT